MGDAIVRQRGMASGARKAWIITITRARCSRGTTLFPIKNKLRGRVPQHSRRSTSVSRSWSAFIRPSPPGAPGCAGDWRICRRAWRSEQRRRPSRSTTCGSIRSRSCSPQHAPTNGSQQPCRRIQHHALRTGALPTRYSTGNGHVVALPMAPGIRASSIRMPAGRHSWLCRRLRRLSCPHLAASPPTGRVCRLFR